jgi:hypothetical protein
VHDPLRVRVLQCLGDFLRDAQRLVEGELPLAAEARRSLSDSPSTYGIV